MARPRVVIEFPDAAPLPADLDQEFLRYAVAGALYNRGAVSGAVARMITGDSRRTFEEKMAEYGFPLLPDRDEDVAAELNA